MLRLPKSPKTCPPTHTTHTSTGWLLQNSFNVRPESSLPAARSTAHRKRMFAVLFKSSGKRQDLASSPPGSIATTLVTLGRPLGERAGLVEEERGRPYREAPALRRREQESPARAPRPTATMIDMGVARPSAQGQAMISTATALTSA